jgi:hypothetical protein
MYVTFTRNVVTRENDLDICPGRVFSDFLVDKVLELLMELDHEMGARSNAIRVEWRLFWEFFAFSEGLSTRVCRFLCRSKPPGSLLVHFCPWCDAINRQKKEFLGFNLCKDMVNVLENGEENVGFGDAKVDVVVILVGAVVNDAIHVQVQVVYI